MFSLPQTPVGALLLAIPVVTLLAALLHFLFPRIALRHHGLEAVPERPWSVGEGRSTFAGGLAGVAAANLLLNDPNWEQQQIGLMFTMAACWLFSAVGLILYMVIDGVRSKRVLFRLFLALALGGAALFIATPVQFDPGGLGNREEWYSAISAIITIGFGIWALAAPEHAARTLGLRRVSGKPHGFGTFRGEVAGFNLGMGVAALFLANLWILLMLGLFWAMTAFGRMIAMLSDRGNNIFNWSALIAELVLAGLPLGVVFGFL